MAAFATLVCQRNCVFLCKGTKLQKAALFAIVCRFLVLPPLRPGFAKDIAFLSAKAKSFRIRHSPNSGTVRRFPVLPTPCAKTAKSCAFCVIRRSRILRTVCRFSLWNSARCFRIQRKLNSGALARGFW